VKRGLKIVTVVVAAVAIVIVGVVIAASALSERKLHRSVNIEVAPVAFQNDAAAVERGKYLYGSRGCAECHGADGRGRTFIDDQKGGLYAKAPNISGGHGGVVANYTERDWVRAIRHGVSPQGRPLLIMPSEDYNRLTDADLAALVAYVRSLPPVDGEGAVLRLPLIVKALYAFGVVKDSAEKIDHSLPPSKPVPVGATVEHGAYVATMCIGCHGAGFSGGKIPGGPPDWPPAANLTPGAGSVMPRYQALDQFQAMMRTGKRPDGSAVSTVMPFGSLKTLNDTDLAALHTYLKTLSPRSAGNR
jgi:mono/diheme cytochrome c family protein